MDDELELLRTADPVSAHTGPWRERPLGHRAERELNQLLYRSRRKKIGRRLVLRAEAAALALFAVLAYTLSGPGSTPAAAVPAALQVRSGDPSVPLAELARRAEAYAAAAGPGAGPHRGSHLQSWYLDRRTGTADAPPLTVPEERLTRWNADGSGAELVVATDPRHPGRPVIHPTGDGRRGTVEDGKVLHRVVYPAGVEAQRGGLASRTPPPDDPEALRRLLGALYGEADGGTPLLLQALSAFRQEWTPGPRESAAVVRLLASAGDLRPVGQVTDRLGRRGQAYVCAGREGAMEGTRQMLILDPTTGRLLGSETTTTEDIPGTRVEAGAVLSYEAWME
ncbi:CU044_5270 family protein [Streptomyces benahoarensis]|uniref:2-oxoglutarate dehydrogenase n=1 Tax=Streptomyces benahoarensis TaxID=2595054 RepID=A0A553ZCK3_9ACTN|nr:CU044_5270 family protein [Streptomyces benahoarensis]TSB25287.1 2-oxoglutarate dehydrogenase [Streptomyces benahoarensis]TSB39173.1 2-oxoglutarate dehydrogenase [Streptomyces benahoarensis]